MLSFDKLCYTRIQVSVKDLDPSTILQSLNECKKEIERYRHESWMSSGLWLHDLFVSDTEFPIYTCSFQAAFYGLILPLFYLCLFIISGISCYKSCLKSSLEALKVFVVEQSRRPAILELERVSSWLPCCDLLLRIRNCESLVNSVLDVSWTIIWILIQEVKYW